MPKNLFFPILGEVGGCAPGKVRGVVLDTTSCDKV